MIYIGICDDDKYFLDYVENRIEEVLKDENTTIKINKLTDGMELLKAYNNEDKPFDIIFLDIDMPNIDGIETAEIIRKKDEETILIFLTSMEDEVYKTFKYGPFRFIRKSHIDRELHEALISSLEKLKDEKHVFKTVYGDLALYISDILYFEFVDRTVYIKTLFYFFLIFSDILAVNILSSFIGKDIKDIVINQTWARILFSQISKLLLFIILRVIKNNHSERELDIPKYYWYWIFIVSLISGINLLIVFNIGLILNDLNVEIQYLTVAISVGSLLIVIITYYIFMKLNSFYRERNNYRIVEIKNEMLTKEMEEKERIYEGVRKIHHDFKNHIMCIERLLEQGKFQLANEYIGGLKDEVVETYTWIKTGNDAVDAILNQKKSEGTKKSIEMDMKVNIPEDINIQPLDLCTILGNALDNGIEANERIEDINKRNISVTINTYKEYLFIEISNPSLINPIDEEGRLNTIKEDKENHGFGMKSIKSVVEKYNGILNYEYHEGKFILNIMLPIEKES
ncbi:GHKL domain-containing protein [Clostridium sp. Cult2]|uniref:GHKL domain-containing protein n=1 Tax=Clostridium sp. Cult2 TaxID=2079003 RepID=UPI001F354AB1|nr:GHKL domain-containing protein [Clostridium sp. Cult2]